MVLLRDWFGTVIRLLPEKLMMSHMIQDKEEKVIQVLSASDHWFVEYTGC